MIMMLALSANCYRRLFIILSFLKKLYTLLKGDKTKNSICKLSNHNIYYDQSLKERHTLINILHYQSTE